MKTRTLFLTLIIAILLGAFALRLWQLDTESLWHDEGWSIRAIESPFTTPDDNTPFLYYLTGHLLWRAIGGDSPFVYRYTSVLLGVVTVAVAILLSRRWLIPRTAVMAGILVAVNPLLWDYAQEVRAYVAVPLIALLLLLGAGEILRHQRGERVPLRVWLFVFIVEVAGLYTHNLTVPLIVWLNVALGLAWLWRRDFRVMVTWAGWQIALIVAYIPWLLTQAPSGTPLNTPPQIGLALIRDIWASYFLPVLPQLQDALNANSTLLGLIVVLGMVGIAGLVVGNVGKVGDMAGRPYKYAIYLLLTHALLVPIFSTALMLAANIDFHPRYYIAAVPGTLILLVTSRTNISAIWGREKSPALRIGEGFRVGIIFIALIISAWSIQQIRTTRQYQHDDFQAIAEFYATLPADARIVIPFNDEPALEYAFADQISAEFINVPLYSDEATALETIRTLAGRQVELLTWFQLPADPRGMYDCMLGAMSTTIEASVTVFGLSTQGYNLPETLPEFEPISMDSPYRQVGLQTAAVMRGAGGICLRTTWTLTQPIAENVQVAVSILNPFGAPIARMDSEIARDDNVGTATWSEAEQGAAYHLLRLPEGTPAGDYDLLLNVYTPSQPSGFDVLDAGGNPAGKDYRVVEAIRSDGVPADFGESRLLTENVNMVQTGIPLEFTLQIASDSVRDAELTLSGQGWSLTETIALAGDQLAWVQLTIPAGNAGEATLMLDGQPLATFTITDPPRTFDAPPMPITLNTRLADFAMLTGADFPAEISTNQAFDVTLLWESLATPDRSYTVFVQLIDPDGRVLAQSDSLPAQAERPTTGWVAGEFISDSHTLTWNITDYDGDAQLIAGMYDAENGFRRLLTDDGADRVEIGSVMVMP
ncbi:MAG: hypothetical protein RLP44_03715 [Aggregatilineales bacterium]